MSALEDVIFFAVVLGVPLLVFGIPEPIIDVLSWAAPMALKVGIAAVGGSVVRKLVRMFIKHRFALEVPV